jgi:flagellar biosynthesis/type III secretory pathway M-ring protein FliF/YscJ
MVKKYSFETYQKSEKKLLWQDFFSNILIAVSAIFCGGLALYACWHFIIAAIAHPILFLYLGIAVVVGVIIYCSWKNAKNRAKKRRESIEDAMDYQSDIIHWEERLDKLNAVDTSEFDEIKMKAHSNEIDFAIHQIHYYTERRDEEISEYRKYGGKQYV